MLRRPTSPPRTWRPARSSASGSTTSRSRRSTRGIIYCRIKGFGTGSPYEKGLAFDMIAQAAGGPISVTGEPDRPPVKPGPSFGDTGTGMLMAATILGALLRAAADRPGPAAPGRDAGRDDPLHAHLLRVDGAHRQAGAAPRRQDRGRQQRARRPLPVQGRRPERLPLHHDQPRQPRALDPADEADRPRGADRGPALRHRRRAVRTRGELDAIIGEWTRSTPSKRRWRS